MDCCDDCVGLLGCELLDVECLEDGFGLEGCELCDLCGVGCNVACFGFGVDGLDGFGG